MSGRRQPRSLRKRLVITAVALIALVCAVIGTVTTIALHTYLYDQLDKQVRGAVVQSTGGPGPERQAQNLNFLGGPSRPGTIGALVESDGSVTEAAKSVADRDNPIVPLTGAQITALENVPQDGETHSVSVPGLGDYRISSKPGGNTVVGLPETEVQDTLSTLIVVEISVTAAGLVAASLAGAAMVGVALRPLRRVASTATRVSELPLHSGEVALHERVPDTEADPRTEVGQVGAALNRMLDHVNGALEARQQSETRVRQFVADASHELRTPSPRSAATPSSPGAAVRRPGPTPGTRSAVSSPRPTA